MLLLALVGLPMLALLLLPSFHGMPENGNVDVERVRVEVVGLRY